MRYPSPRPRRRRPGGVYRAFLVVFPLVIVGGLTAGHLITKDRFLADQERLTELANASLKSKDRAPSTANDAKVPEANPTEREYPWPQWRGKFRDGVSREVDLLVDWPAEGLKKRWSAPAGKGYSSFVVGGGRVYTLFQDGDHEAVGCWDVETGKEHWRFRYPSNFRNPYGDGPRSTPALVGDRLFTVGGEGAMHCLKISGDQPVVVWKKNLLEDFQAPNIEWGTSFSPLVVGDSVFVMPGGPSGNSIACLHADTGDVRWKCLDDPAGYSSPIAATLASVPQIVFFTGTRVVGVRPDSGDLLWSHPWHTMKECNIATPIIVGDEYLFVSSGYDVGCALVRIEKAGDKQKASVVFKHRKMRSHFSTPVRVGDHIFGFDDSNLACLDLRTGKITWKARGFDRGALTAFGNHLVLQSEKDGVLALAEAKPEEFVEKARFRFTEQTSTLWTPPVIAEGRLFARDLAQIYCFDLRK